jgi:hypothetical protein
MMRLWSREKGGLSVVLIGLVNEVVDDAVELVDLPHGLVLQVPQHPHPLFWHILGSDDSLMGLGEHLLALLVEFIQLGPLLLLLQSAVQSLQLLLLHDAFGSGLDRLTHHLRLRLRHPLLHSLLLLLWLLLGRGQFGGAFGLALGLLPLGLFGLLHGPAVALLDGLCVLTG